jgi:hypothetical protein
MDFLATMNLPKKYRPSEAPPEVIDFVRRLMPDLLRGDHPALEALRDQFRRVPIRDVELTGVGFFVHFETVAGGPMTSPLNFVGGSATLEISSAPNGAGCVLFVRDGRLSMLEGYTYGDEQWSEDAKVLSIKDVVPIRPE